MDDETLAENVKGLTFSAGHRAMSVEDLVRIQPGLGRIMPEIGARTWKLYYAVKADNWPLALFQYKEIKSLFALCAFTRPKHEAGLKQYVETDWSILEAPLKQQDALAFEAAFERCVAAANAWHERTGKPYIVWKLPDSPPPDLDLRPRKRDRESC